MKNIRALLERVYATGLARDVRPESEADILAFEKRHGVALPEDYRGLLQAFGALDFGEEPFLYSLEDLEREYPAFLETWPEFLEGYPDMPRNLDPFPIGGFGDGSLAFVDRSSGKILMLIHDCAEDVPLEVVAESFEALVKERAEGIVSFHEWRESGAVSRPDFA